jgi:hypothetical protein
MHYETHAVRPLLSLSGATAESVVGFGSGTIREEYARRFNSPFAIETALVRLRDSDLACEVTRSLFDTIRQYRESFDVYDTKLSYEWEQLAGEKPVLHSGFEDAKRVDVPDLGSRLPKEIAPYTIHIPLSSRARATRGLIPIWPTSSSAQSWRKENLRWTQRAQPTGR